MISAADSHVTARNVRARYGDISDMTLWRWLADKEIRFPQPLRINRRRYWRLADLEDWERKRARVAA